MYVNSTNCCLTLRSILAKPRAFEALSLASWKSNLKRRQVWMMACLRAHKAENALMSQQCYSTVLVVKFGARAISINLQYREHILQIGNCQLSLLYHKICQSNFSMACLASCRFPPDTI